MVECGNVFKRFFTHLENTGSVSDPDFVKVMVLSLIDDYGDEIVQCNPCWERVLDDIAFSFRGTSCII